MKKLLVKGLTVGMIVAMMTTGLSYADATNEEHSVSEDRQEQMKERFEERMEKRKDEMSAIKEMTNEEKIAYLESKLDNEDLSDEVSEKIQNHIDGIEERMAFDNMLDDLLDGKTDDEKVEALEALLDDGNMEERQEGHINKLIQRYTIGEDVMNEIKSALEGVDKEDRMALVEEMIESGDYSDAAVKMLENQQERQYQSSLVKEELEEIRSSFEGLSKEERAAKVQELIDSGDLNEEITQKLQEIGERREKQAGMRSEMRNEK